MSSVAVTAKTFEYAAAVDASGRASVDGGEPRDVPEDWKPEHFVLAALIRCTLVSLRYHARRAGIENVTASGSASGLVAKRPEDERYAFVRIECGFEVALRPTPPPGALADLLAKAERDCFVGASLTSPPRYGWTVNGRRVRA